MRTQKIVTYSHTDDEVRFLLRWSMMTGAFFGGVVVGVIMQILS